MNASSITAVRLSFLTKSLRQPRLAQHFIALPDYIFAGFVVLSTTLHFAMRQIDPPANLLSWSLALITDQGLHTKAAQLWVKFGVWSTPYNMDFRPAAPLFNLIAAFLYSLFGTTSVVFSTYAVAVNTLTNILVYLISRQIFAPWVALGCCFVYSLIFPVFCFATLGLVEPTAIMFSLAAIYLYGRGISVAGLLASVICSGLAVMTKSHFLSLLVAICAAWAIDIISFWWRDRTRVIALTSALAAALACLIIASTVYLYVMRVEVEIFRVTVVSLINGNKTWRQSAKTLVPDLISGTRATIMMVLIALSSAIGLARIYRSKKGLSELVKDLAKIPRPIGLLTLWVISGSLMLFIIGYRPTRYVLFLAFPLLVLGVFGAGRVVRGPVAGAAMIFALIAMLGFQTPFYVKWLRQSPSMTKDQAYKDIARYVQDNSGQGNVALVGEEAAEIGLNSSRIMPLELQFVPSGYYGLCQRLDHWKPRFYVRVEREANMEDALLASCPEVHILSEVLQYKIDQSFYGKIILYRLAYY